MVIMAHIMASVLPQVTTISLSGSMARPMAFPCFSATASRKFCAPKVMEYWCGPSLAARASASVISLGGSKSGNPWDRLTAPYRLLIRVIRRITESVKVATRSLNSGICCSSPACRFAALTALVPSSYSPFDPKSTFRGLPLQPRRAVLRTGPACCPDKWPRALSAGIPAGSCNKAGIPGSARCPARGPRF